MVYRAFIFILIFLICFLLPMFAKAELSDHEIRKELIAESIADYEGSCPCPYSVMSNGYRCGNRSAWSRPGGESPLCYLEDVSDKMIANYKRRMQ